jgi:hypothetical protein
MMNHVYRLLPKAYQATGRSVNKFLQATAFNVGAEVSNLAPQIHP